MNRSPKPHDALIAFAVICREAAQRHGDDWQAINKHIKKCVDALPEDRRAQLASEVDRVMRYCAPTGGGKTQ